LPGVYVLEGRLIVYYSIILFVVLSLIYIPIYVFPNTLRIFNRSLHRGTRYVFSDHLVHVKTSISYYGDYSLDIRIRVEDNGLSSRVETISVDNRSFTVTIPVSITGFKILINNTLVNSTTCYGGIGHRLSIDPGGNSVDYTISYSPICLLNNVFHERVRLRNYFNITIFINTTLGVFKYNRIVLFKLLEPSIRVLPAKIIISNRFPYKIIIHYNISFLSGGRVIARILNRYHVVDPYSDWTYHVFPSNLRADNAVVDLRIDCPELDYTMYKSVLVSRY
jgi:hypothetical protein